MVHTIKKMRGFNPRLATKPTISKMKRQVILNRTKTLTNRLTDLQMLKGRSAQISELEISNICLLVTDVLLEEPSCLTISLNQPLHVIGDLFGYFSTLLQTLDTLGHPPGTRYLFLGNYVNRGDRSVETIALLLAYKLLYPDRIFLLRGNHECDQLGRNYGFYAECSSRFSHRLWNTLMDTFNYLPITAIVENSLFCTHSGISPCLLYSGCSGVLQLQSYINQWIRRPTEIEANLLLTHFVWSEPDPEVTDWERNPAGLGYLFGPTVVGEFCERFNMLQLVRSNELVSRGYEFFTNNRLVTLFTAAGFVGQHKNDGSVLTLTRVEKSRDVLCRFHTLKPTVTTRGKLIGGTTLVVQDTPAAEYLSSGFLQEEENSDQYQAPVANKDIHNSISIEEQ